MNGLAVQELMKSHLRSNAPADIVGIQEDCPTKSSVILDELGEGWYRAGKLYSKFPAQLLHSNKDRSLEVVDVELAGSRVVRIVNCHWWPNNYGPFLAQEKLRADPQLDLNHLAKLVKEKGARRGGTRGYRATIEPLEKAIEEKRAIFLVGDFNEPSHLDWTEHYAKNGSDRWVENPTGTPLRLALQWPGSVLLKNIGMVDSFRQAHPNESKSRAILGLHPILIKHRAEDPMAIRSWIGLIEFITTGTM